MTYDCPLCDGLGVIDDPLKVGAIKACPECDSDPPFYLTHSLAAIVGPPEEGEVAAVEERNRQIKEARRWEEQEFLATGRPRRDRVPADARPVGR